MLDLKNDHFEKVSILSFHFMKKSSRFFAKLLRVLCKTSSRKIAVKTNKTINRNAFMVINQYITELLKFMNLMQLFR